MTDQKCSYVLQAIYPGYITMTIVTIVTIVLQAISRLHHNDNCDRQRDFPRAEHQQGEHHQLPEPRDGKFFTNCKILQS